MPDDAIEPTSEDAVEPTPEDADETMPDNVIEPTSDDAVEPTPEDAVEAMLDNAIKPTPEDAVEPKPEDAVESIIDDVVENMNNYRVKFLSDDAIEAILENTEDKLTAAAEDVPTDAEDVLAAAAAMPNHAETTPNNNAAALPPAGIERGPIATASICTISVLIWIVSALLLAGYDPTTTTTTPTSGRTLPAAMTKPVLSLGEPFPPFDDRSRAPVHRHKLLEGVQLVADSRNRLIDGFDGFGRREEEEVLFIPRAAEVIKLNLCCLLC
ncbi:hypothetical protein GTA08_BOTSDO12669 [Botryosphaeria dothidea]|uniref:Uncharacterized protein n=1 Tax=Botryosphaeria dothidea TaxID=55169 RepID=A0A8H4J4C8_9PEZI|nr:hypothetical protein GTA08_BOTSDO13994 [Botryosphaeria dothidea]KAF4311734.1 hypothetical protein GTA08_BOTSDO12669 [Botryosphaeria dothidea]